MTMMGLFGDVPQTSIVLIGYEAPSSKRRQTGGKGVRLFGHRENDAAQRLVAVLVSSNDAAVLLKHWTDNREEQIIEVDSRMWTHVSHVEPGEMAVQMKEDR